MGPSSHWALFDHFTPTHALSTPIGMVSALSLCIVLFFIHVFAFAAVRRC